MSRDPAAGRSANCGISIPGDARCNKATSDNQALCQLNPVSNRCEFAKIPGKNKKYTLKDVQAILSAPAPVLASRPPVSDPSQPHRQSQAFRMENATLRVAVTEWRINPEAARVRYGNISTWNTTDVTDMSGLFCNDFSFYNNNSSYNNFNEVLGDWDTSNVTTMSGMFFATQRFDKPLNDWDTRNVVDMSNMFSLACKFNQPLDKWNTSKVRSMCGMFAGASRFNRKLDTWDTRLVTTMEGMFRKSTFNKPIGRWKTGQVTSMAVMFSKSHFNQPLNDWDVSSVRQMTHMFSRSFSFDQRLGDWKTGQVTSMTGMFYRSKFNQPIGGWDTHNVTDMRNMFLEAPTFNQPLHNWHTGNVTDMSSMFQYARGFDQPLDHFTTGQVVDMSSMFHSAFAFNRPIGDWDTGRVVNMSCMFFRAFAFNQPIGGWQTSSVRDMHLMFHEARAFNQPLDTWELDYDLVMHDMFEYAPLMLRRYPKGKLPHYATGELWGKVRAGRRSVNKRLRFKWQELCDVSSDVSVGVLRGLALEAGIPSAATLSRRELCAAFSRLWSSQADDAATALPGCTNERGLMQYPVADTPPEFFYRYTHDGTVYCDDIRHLYEHVRNSTKNPYTNLPYSQQIIDDIRATYRRLRATTRSMADFDEDEEVVSFSSNLSRKLAELMSKLYYPNNPELFRSASEVHFSVFVQSLQDFGVISTNERAMVDGQSTLDERKALLVDLLILKIDQDPDQQPTSHGPVSRVAYDASEVYNNLFI